MPVSQASGCHAGPTFRSACPARPRAPGRSGGRACQAGLQVPGCQAGRPPSPEASGGPGPGDPWPAKVGSASRLVKGALWTALCTVWGAGGVFLWMLYGVARRDPAIFGCNLITFLFIAGIAWVKWRP